MKKTFIFIVVLSFIPFIKISAQCAQTANIYSFTYNGHSYEIVKELKTWTNAASCAVERGGYLVAINDANEQNFIYNQIQQSGISSTYTQVADGGGTAYLWIGATDKFTEGTWKWDGNNSNTGTNFWNGQGAAGAGGGSAAGNEFVNWGGKSTGTIQEPDDYGAMQDAAGIALAGWPSGTTFLGIAGEWNDLSLSNSLYFIIEKNNIGINENNPNKIELFPNPAKHFIQIKGVDDLNALIKIVNIDGKTINEFSFSKLSENKINIEDLPSGFYMVNIISESITYVLRFVK